MLESGKKASCWRSTIGNFFESRSSQRRIKRILLVKKHYVCVFQNQHVLLQCVVSLLQICLEETMRASVVLLFAFLALAFVAAYAAVEVSVIVSIATYIALKLLTENMSTTRLQFV